MKLLLMYSTHEPTSGHIARLGEMGCEVEIASGEPDAIAKASEAEVILGHRYLRQSLPSAARLRWVHSTAGGVDRLPLEELAAREITLTRSTCMAGVIARHSHASAWALTRGFIEFAERQKTGSWNPHFQWLPFPRKAMIFGRGAIGSALAKLLGRDGVAVTIVHRSVTHWRELLPDMDWIFVALPATPETAHFVDRQALESMKPSAIVALPGRAETIDVEALCEQLAAGRLGAAALDVVPAAWHEPSHPAWRTPRLLITPHVAAHCAERPALLEREAEEQVRRYLAKEELANTVPLAST